MWQRVLLFGAAFLACAEASGYLSVRDSAITSYWLPAGLYIAVLLRSERRSWPWLVAAAFAANLIFDLSHGTSLAVALLFCVANAVQAVSGAWLISWVVAPCPALTTLEEFLALVGFGAVLSTAAGAAIGAATLSAFGLTNSFARSWEVWWGSTAMSILLLAPFIMTAGSISPAERRRLTRPKKLLEAALLLATLGALLAHLLIEERGVMSLQRVWLYAPLLWAALRFGPLGAAATTLLASVVLAFFTTQFQAGLTPQNIASGDYVLAMQTVFAAAGLIIMIPALVLAERDEKILQLRKMARRLVEVQEIERRAINRELHDRAGQNLSALRLNLEVLRRHLRSDATEAAARLADTQALLDTTARQVRDVMAELRPPALDEYGLLAALRHHAAVVSARLGIAISVAGRDPEPRLPLATETALFRIVQEALNNVAKHARAKSVTVNVAPRADGGVTLSVVDDGVGFDAAQPQPRGPTYGIRTMRERAEAAGIRLKLASAQGRGTRIDLEVGIAAA